MNETPDEPRSSLALDAAFAAAMSLTPFTSALMAVLDVVKEHQNEVAMQTLRDMLHDLQPEQVQERLKSDPDVQAMFVNGVDYAMRTGVLAKRRVLARAVRAAIEHEDKVDESWLIIDTLGQLDSVHIRAMVSIRRIMFEGTESWPPRGHQAIGDVNRLLNEALPKIPQPIRSALVRTGCLQPPTNMQVTGAGRYNHITDFGLMLLEHLESVDPDQLDR